MPTGVTVGSKEGSTMPTEATEGSKEGSAICSEATEGSKEGSAMSIGVTKLPYNLSLIAAAICSNSSFSNFNLGWLKFIASVCKGIK